MSTVITAELTTGVAKVGDIVARGRTPVLNLCRALVAAGADPAARLEVHRGTVLTIVVKTIGIGAQLTIKERDRGGLEIALYEPFPASSKGAAA
jgi:hypothetical protein